ncbi:MAG: glycosyltransferase family 61 protein [Lentisphaeria bacterium]|nr:glycosyltransferase family 61 protein [Lentisphaeria bacterium]
MSYNSLLNRLVQKFTLPPWISAWRYLKCVEPNKWSHFDKNSTYREITSEEVMSYPLPKNISERDLLIKERADGLSHSFYDVPFLKSPPSYILTIPNCELIRYQSEWGGDFYAIIKNGKTISAPGVGYSANHRKSRCSSPRTIKKGVWFLGTWYKNYYLWHTSYIPRIMLAIEQGLRDYLVFPDEERFKSFQKFAFQSLGLSPKVILNSSESHWHFEEPTIVYDYPYRGTQLQKFRDQMTQPDVTAFRKVFISRQKAQWRKLVNHDAVQALLI